MKLWHFEIIGQFETGSKYGSCGLNKKDAMIAMQERLDSDNAGGVIKSATYIGTCDWSYPTVLCYS